MGQPKLLLPFASATVIEHVIRAWQASAVSGVVIVVRSDDHDLRAVCEATSANLVIAETPPAEMKDSVQLGLQFVEQNCSPADEDVWLLAPADMPELSPAIVDALLDAHEVRAPAILAPMFGGKRGHPVLFPWAMALKVEELGADEGVNALLARHDFRRIACADPSILHDLDSPDDYQRLRNRHDPS